MVELTIQIPDELAVQLQPMQNHLPEIIRLGLREIAVVPSGLYGEVVDFLASGPAPQAIINFRPSPQAITRIQALLAKNRAGQLSAEEQAELDYYENLDYLMTLIKAHARKRFLGLGTNLCM